jgi:hypothetical protein
MNVRDTANYRDSITIIGHPFASTGVGEQMRSHISALLAVGAEPRVVDTFKFASREDPNHIRLIRDREVSPRAVTSIRIFHINGDEVETAIAALEQDGFDFSDGYNVIVPAWELPIYPAKWAALLRRFDAVWALSSFIHSGLLASGLKSTYVGQSAEVGKQAFLPRAYFGIRESAFVLLHFFDTTSFAARKNPLAVIELYKNLRAKWPYGDFQLVLKVKEGEITNPAWEERLRLAAPDALILGERLTGQATLSLLSCADCYVSLHRAEGFGRGLAESMYLGRLALATGWSGNLDFMNGENSLMVPYELKSVPIGEYPFGDGQVWAEPDLSSAAALVGRAMSDSVWARKIAKRGQADVQLVFSHRSVGLRMLNALSS